MEPLNAVVKNGRLTLDVPSTLPEGQVVVLLPLEELLAEADAYAAGTPTKGVSFEIVSAPPRSFKKKKPVDAAALIAEIRAI